MVVCVQRVLASSSDQDGIRKRKYRKSRRDSAPVSESVFVAYFTTTRGVPVAKRVVLEASRRGLS